MFRSVLKPRHNPGPSSPETRQVEVNGKSVPLTIRRNAQATRLTLRIEPGGRALRMTVPTGLSEREIRDFLDRHHPWLMTKLARFSTRSALSHGNHIFIRGVAHRIEETGRLRGLTETLMVDGEAVLHVSGLPEHVPRRISDYLKKEARRDLEERVAVHAAKVGRKVRSLTLRDTRSRWGSCSADGALSFSWRIVMAPPFVIDYLAAHEVAHLREMNHGPAFWSLCGELCARVDEAKHWLKRNGTMLHALDFD